MRRVRVHHAHAPPFDRIGRSGVFFPKLTVNSQLIVRAAALVAAQLATSSPGRNIRARALAAGFPAHLLPHDVPRARHEGRGRRATKFSQRHVAAVQGLFDRVLLPAAGGHGRQITADARSDYLGCFGLGAHQARARDARAQRRLLSLRLLPAGASRPDTAPVRDQPSSRRRARASLRPSSLLQVFDKKKHEQQDQDQWAPADDDDDDD